MKMNELSEQMKRSWDEGARRHPYFCVASGPQYLRDDIDYDRYFESGEDSVTAMFLLAGWNPGLRARALEIGCGTGRITQALAKRFASVDAIDVSSDMVRIAERDLANIRNVRFHVTNGIDLRNFPDASFDYACSELVFRHIPSREVIRTYLLETGRILTHGGRFAFQFNGKRVWHVARLFTGSRYVLRSLFSSARRRLASGHVDPGYTLAAAWRDTRISAREVRRTVRLAGLTVERLIGEGSDQMWVIGHKPPSTTSLKDGHGGESAASGNRTVEGWKEISACGSP